jgi:GGDEF domain-containing protein
MPTELLLPAFALTLLANAALVAVAIQWLLRARAERDDPSPPKRQRRTDQPAPESAGPAVEPTVAAPPIRSDPVAPEPTSDVGTPPASEPARPPRRPRAAAPGPVVPKPAPARKTRGSTPATPRSVASVESTKRSRGAARDVPTADSRRGGRRRFSLPPLDDDHERVNRSIETFLTGSDGSDGSDPGRASTTGATTVAMVAIDGLDPDPGPAGLQAVDSVVSTVERTLRGAARSADRVTSLGNGRFRVVLSATGELAARAYLRRIRTTVGPSLATLDLPLDLVTATATVLDDTVPIAIAQAEARLDAALASAARRASDDEPRAAPR